MTTSGQAFEPPEPNPLAASITTYTTNELNQYPQITRQGITIGFSSDLDGNLTNEGKFQYAYDTENRLIAVTPMNPVDDSKKVGGINKIGSIATGHDAKISPAIPHIPGDFFPESW